VRVGGGGGKKSRLERQREGNIAGVSRKNIKRCVQQGERKKTNSTVTGHGRPSKKVSAQINTNTVRTQKGCG